MVATVADTHLGVSTTLAEAPRRTDTVCVWIPSGSDGGTCGTESRWRGHVGHG